jgi:hypothetical protein
MQQSRAVGHGEGHLPIEGDFNEASYQSIATLLSPERARHHVRTLAELIEQASLSSVADVDRSAVHKLISISASLGFDQISLSCRRVEQAFAEGRSRSEAFAQFCRAAEAARPTIRKLTART